ncbi:MAG: hypothetical protein GEU90_16485 [Gemmatimonas sp.]|nr:hypothetical protein [Gemmatimonas sp.]
MFTRVLFTEVMKLRRSRITWISLLAYSVGPAAGGLFMWIALEPRRAADLGLLGTKADLAGLTATWPGYFGLLTQTTGIAGMLLVSVITAYVFGREYADKTARVMLVQPVPRYWFVIAKLVVVLGWMAAGTGLMIAEAALVGVALGLPGLTPSIAANGVADLLLAAGIAFLLASPVAWLSALGRGYLLPLGFAIVMLVIGNILGATAWGRWFPWSIVPLFAGVAGPRAETLAAGSMAVVVCTAAAGMAATIAQLTWADQRQ